MSLDSILRATGKNLFDKNTTPQFTSSSSSATYTVSGTTITFKSNNTVNNSFYYSIPVEIGKTYTVSVSSIDWDSTSFGIFLSSTRAADSSNYGIINKTTLSKTFTTTSDTLWIHGYLSYGAGDFTFSFDKLQVEEGNAATSYEPYQQGPKTIKIPYRGNNIITYPYENTTQTINGVTFTVGKDGGITINGTPTDTTKFDVKNSITLEQNKQYTLSGFKERPEGSAGAVFHLDTIDGMLQNITIDSQYQTQTFTADSLSYYCYIIVPTTGDLVDNIVFYPQLEEGTVATEFSLNTGDKEVLKVSYGSRNLWQNTNTTFPTGLSYDSATQIYTLGTGTTGYNFVAHTLTNPIPAGTTVTISIMFQSGKGKSVFIGGYHRTGGRSWQGYISVPFNVDMTGQTLTSTFTTTETVEEFMFLHNTGDNIEEPFIFKVQYEMGNKATEYVPYSREVVWTK